MPLFDDLFSEECSKGQDDASLESLLLSVQMAIQKSMHENCVTQRELSERLGISAARVSQIIRGHDSNLTLKTISRIADALGDEFELISKGCLVDALGQNGGFGNQLEYFRALTTYADRWTDATANENKFPQDSVKARAQRVAQ